MERYTQIAKVTFREAVDNKYVSGSGTVWPGRKPFALLVVDDEVVQAREINDKDTVSASTDDLLEVARRMYDL